MEETTKIKEFDNVKWEDIILSNQTISNIQGKDPKDFLAKDIKVICIRLMVRIVKNAKKDVLIQK